MGIIKLILFVIILIAGIISMISYYQDKGEMKRTQLEILEGLTSKRVLTQKEAEIIKKIYKVNLDNNTPVYSLTGSIGYIVFETNGQGRKEWLIADVLIAHKSVKILEKKGIKLEGELVDEKDVNSKIEIINKKLEAEEITEAEAVEQSELAFEKYAKNTIEFVVNPLNREKPVYLLSYKNRDSERPYNLLT